jgi:hypothetical protein
MVETREIKGMGGRRNTARHAEPVERRESARVPLSLSAELIELQAGSRITGRMSDSSKTGCYIDSLNCFPALTLLRIQLFKGKEVFEADGRVVYSHPGLGMGILFTDISPEQRERLNQWMAEGSRQAEFARNRREPLLDKKAPMDSEERFEALLQLLVDRNVITAGEARRVQADILV